MIPTNFLKLKLTGIAILALFIIALIITVIINTFRGDRQNTGTILPTPTTISTSVTPRDPKSYQFTPLEVTTIGQTTDQQISQQNIVLSKRIVGDVTIYSVRSRQPGKTDEIRTKNGVVIFEKTSTYTNLAPLPKIKTIESQFGKPEETKDKVGEGFYVSAYLYPTQGFAIYANRYTGSVYEVQRFTPMSLTDYRQQYGQSLSPAPQMPKESFDIR